MKKFLKRFQLKILTGNRFRDYLQLQIFFCNFIGFTISVWGYGIEFMIKIFDPKDKAWGDDNG